ncbi:hypothetical protein L2E82_43400 [Cichorium intybus]|uniref:Uncharacterized protein n=1 Tax=Cichorium intybus TaxID=13427 RepID=A0ACB8ZMP8_CICIN|nr:hypothetical protein L2E82_43400 [Cichorium intybus]
MMISSLSSVWLKSIATARKLEALSLIDSDTIYTQGRPKGVQRVPLNRAQILPGAQKFEVDNHYPNRLIPLSNFKLATSILHILAHGSVKE